MTIKLTLSASKFWPPQIDKWLLQKDFDSAIDFYEQAIETNPAVKFHYWHLGLLWLLQHHEEEAQTVWLMALADGEPDQIESWTTELIHILDVEATQQEHNHLETAWLIRCHIREIQPSNITNLLRLILLSFQLGRLVNENLISSETIALLQAAQPREVNPIRVLPALEAVLQTIAHDPIILDFTDACLPLIRDIPSAIAILLRTGCFIAYSFKMRRLAAALVERALQFDPQNLEVLGYLASFHQDGGNYQAGIETARSRYALANKPAEKIFSNHLILRGLMSAGGYWNEALTTLEHHKQLLPTLTEQHLAELDLAHIVRLFNAYYYLPYFHDRLAENRAIQNQIARLCQQTLQQAAIKQVESFRQAHLCRPLSTKPLKIGYLSHCMAEHSVGWIAR